VSRRLRVPRPGTTEEVPWRYHATWRPRAAASPADRAVHRPASHSPARSSGCHQSWAQCVGGTHRQAVPKVGRPSGSGRERCAPHRGGAVLGGYTCYVPSTAGRHRPGQARRRRVPELDRGISVRNPTNEIISCSSEDAVSEGGSCGQVRRRAPTWRRTVVCVDDSRSEGMVAVCRMQSKISTEKGPREVRSARGATIVEAQDSAEPLTAKNWRVIVGRLDGFRDQPVLEALDGCARRYSAQ